jgi:hypothetical protein
MGRRGCRLTAMLVLLMAARSHPAATLVAVAAKVVTFDA